MSQKTINVDAELLTVKDVAAMLGVAENTVWNWRHAGEMAPATKIGRRVLWRRSEIEAWLDTRTEARR